jgi:hypothetical protein
MYRAGTHDLWIQARRQCLQRLLVNLQERREFNRCELKTMIAADPCWVRKEFAAEISIGDQSSQDALDG